MTPLSFPEPSALDTARLAFTLQTSRWIEDSVVFDPQGWELLAKLCRGASVKRRLFPRLRGDKRKSPCGGGQVCASQKRSYTTPCGFAKDFCVFHSEGIIELEPDGNDRFGLFSAALPVMDVPMNVLASFLVRERCRNVTLFPKRIDLSTSFDALQQLRQTPLTPDWAARIEPLLLEPQHRACLAGTPPDLFEVVD
ncbi:MAG: hypothetical protein HY360_11140, partial [Verrucomicrobia bacterium]|nr:hypothetical protein [Verrucomicrobiota bacterium]